jgi:hypothetical protein
MPPRPTEILQNVETDMQRWDQRQQKRRQQLGLTEKPGQPLTVTPSTNNAKP